MSLVPLRVSLRQDTARQESARIGGTLRPHSAPAVEPAIPLDYRHLLDALADPVVAADTENRVIYANRAVERLLGWTPQELIGEPLITLIPERFRPAHIAGFNRYMATGQGRIMGHPVHVPALRRDGSEVDIELTLSDLSAPGSDRLIVASLRDLRERVELERQLSITRHLRAVTRAAAELTSLLDLTQVVDRVVTSLASDFNAALVRIWLYDAEQRVLSLQGEAGDAPNSGLSAPPRIEVDSYPFKIAETARQRLPYVQNGLLGDPQFDQEWVRRDHIESVAILPLIYAGELLGVLAYFAHSVLPDEVIEAIATLAAITTTAIHDVRVIQQEQHFRTQSVEAERRSGFLAEAGEVLASSLEYETTLSNVAQLAVVRLADWCVVDVIEPDGRLRRVATAHADPGRVAFVEEMQRRFPPGSTGHSAVMRVIESGEPQLVPVITQEQVEAVARGPAHLHMLQELDPLSYMCVPLTIRERTLGAITFLTSRRSARVYASADLSLAQELARRAAVAVDNARLYRELQEAIRVRDEFLSSVSHDLKNPLATIKARAQLLRRRVMKRQGAEGAWIVEGLENIDGTSAKMTRLIDDLVDVVHLRIGRPLTLRCETINLAELVRVVAGEQQATHGRTITVQAPDEITGSFDAVRIERVLFNLLSNAVKYSPEGGSVAVTVREEESADGPLAVISVSDEGIGIPAGEISSVFDRFFRASNAAAFAGTGIGLAGSRQIVEQHGGTISVESEQGKGTTFTVTLPLA